MLLQADGFQLLSRGKLSNTESFGVVILFPDDQVGGGGTVQLHRECATGSAGAVNDVQPGLQKFQATAGQASSTSAGQDQSPPSGRNGHLTISIRRLSHRAVV